jgi:hypothetical protein
VNNRITLERAMTDREHEQLLAAATERFERRLSEDVGAVRVDIAAMRLELAERDNATRLELAERDTATRLELAERDKAIRLELAERDNATRLELAERDKAIRLEVAESNTATRLEIARLRVDMTEQFADSRVQTESRHRELLKWALMFWVAQAAATAGIVSALT